MYSLRDITQFSELSFLRYFNVNYAVSSKEQLFFSNTQPLVLFKLQ